MNAEIIVVGSQERVADAALKNAEYLRGQLKNIGITLSGQSAALTNPGRLERMFASAMLLLSLEALGLKRMIFPKTVSARPWDFLWS